MRRLFLSVCHNVQSGTRGSLMVDAVDWVERSGHGTYGSVNVLCSWAKQVTLTVPLTIQENKWVLANFQGSLMKCWGVSLR